MLDINKIEITTSEIDGEYENVRNADDCEELWFSMITYNEYEYAVDYNIYEGEGRLVFGKGDVETKEYPDPCGYPMFAMNYTADATDSNWIGDLVTEGIRFLAKCVQYIEENGEPDEIMYF